MKIQPTYVYLGVAVLMLLGGFYWYEYRPSEIKQECSAFITERSRLQENLEDHISWIEGWTAVCIAAGGPEAFMRSIDSGDAEAANRASTHGPAKPDYAVEPAQ